MTHVSPPCRTHRVPCDPHCLVSHSIIEGAATERAAVAADLPFPHAWMMHSVATEAAAPACAHLFDGFHADGAFFGVRRMHELLTHV